jgi:aminoglycoside phosphotransferase (APT) family kinase protein
MPPRDIEELCRAIVPGAGSVAVEPLGAGLLSETYRVERSGEKYTLKIAAAHRPDLGMDLTWEVRLLERAAMAGLAARVCYFDPASTVLLAQWVAGRPWSQDAKGPANLRRIAALLRRVHALDIPLPPRAISPSRWIELHAAALSGRPSYSADPELSAAGAARVKELAGFAPAPLVVCHSDLHALNLIEQNDALILLDWEYAHATDPLWDLASWSANNDLPAESQRQLLSDYGGGPPPAGDWRRFRLLLWLYDYVCLLWSQLYLCARLEGARGEAAKAVAERARLLDARLHLAAHYAA